MKSIIVGSIILLAFISAAAFYRTSATQKRIPTKIVESYNRWKQIHGKLYGTPAESNYRLEVFYDLTLYIERTNESYEKNAKLAGDILDGPMFEMNMFGDLTTEEFKARYTGAKVSDSLQVDQPNEEAQQKDEGVEEASLSSNGLGQTYNIKIRDQGSCGSCWAFAAIACTEKFHYDTKKQDIDLSPQELVDCERKSLGCSGGWPEYAFEYIKKNGIMPASKYPYRSSQSPCKRNYQSTDAVRPSINANSQHRGFTIGEAQELAKRGRIAAITLYSSGAFRFASSQNNVLDARAAGECNKMMDHILNMFTIKGDVITVFNSWGTGWGVKGYKQIKLCSNNEIYGSGTRIAHTF